MFCRWFPQSFSSTSSLSFIACAEFFQAVLLVLKVVVGVALLSRLKFIPRATMVMRFMPRGFQVQGVVFELDLKKELAIKFSNLRTKGSGPKAIWKKS